MQFVTASSACKQGRRHGVSARKAAALQYTHSDANTYASTRLVLTVRDTAADVGVGGSSDATDDRRSRVDASVTTRFTRRR